MNSVMHSKYAADIQYLWVDLILYDYRQRSMLEMPRFSDNSGIEMLKSTDCRENCE